MTNSEPTTEVFFAVEVLSDGSLQIHREKVDWSTTARISSIPEIAEISSRVVKELERHLIVTQVTDRMGELLDNLMPSPPVPFSEKLVEALKTRGISTTPETSSKEGELFPFPLRPGGKGTVYPPPQRNEDK
jgi:hypothetical protein